MLIFGLGTMPAVIGVGVIGGMLAKMNRYKQIIGILFIVLAIFSAMPWLNPMRLHHL
jgi:sulfite exporter TauE/SafE